MEDKKNKKDSALRNASSQTPAHLLASVLEQRYAHKSRTKVTGKDEKPDPMTFPAVQKALGPVYSTLVEIVEEEIEDETAVNEAESEETAADTEENNQKLGEQLLDMVDRIEESEREKEKEKKAVVVEVQRKKEDPYNRAVNSHSASFDDIDTIEIEEEVTIETIVSGTKKKKGEA